jgi:hypothetical protein
VNDLVATIRKNSIPVINGIFYDNTTSLLLHDAGAEESIEVYETITRS